MQPIVIAKPYQFVPPRYSRVWHAITRFFLRGNLRKQYGIASVECVDSSKLRASLEAGHGVLLAINHCRPCDPMVMDYLAQDVRRPFHVVANWHLFMGGWLRRFLLPRIGAFSVHRESTDRESLKCCVKTVAEGRFPLMVFAEGIISRCNDRLLDLMDGPAFMARAAAKQNPDGKVMIHPVFIRYFFEGDLEKSISPVLEDIERRMSWQAVPSVPTRERILRIGHALLARKEEEFLGAEQTSPLRDRLAGLLEAILVPLENRWTPTRHDGLPMVRVKRLRTAILPELVSGELSPDDQAARWKDLADLYLVQQLCCYPHDYLDHPTPERLLETVERFEEDLTDVARPHFPMRVVITVGDAIEATPSRPRGVESDPLTASIRESLLDLMERSKAEGGRR